MKIVIKTKNLKLNQALKNFIEKKINSLEKFFKTPPLFPPKQLKSLEKSQAEKYINISSKISYKKGAGTKVRARVEIGKEGLHHRKGQVFYAECQVRFPKKSLRSAVRAKDLKLAITEVKDELQRELKQYKEKITSQTKRRARVLKKELKLSPSARFYRKGRIREESL